MIIQPNKAATYQRQKKEQIYKCFDYLGSGQVHEQRVLVLGVQGVNERHARVGAESRGKNPNKKLGKIRQNSVQLGKTRSNGLIFGVVGGKQGYERETRLKTSKNR